MSVKAKVTEKKYLEVVATSVIWKAILSVVWTRDHIT